MQMHFSRCFACLEVDQCKMQQERALNPQKSRPGRSCRHPPIVSEPFFPPALCVSAAAQVFGIIFTIAQGKIIDRFGTLASNIFLCVFLVIGTIMTGEGKQNFISGTFAFVQLRVGRCPQMRNGKNPLNAGVVVVAQRRNAGVWFASGPKTYFL